MKANKSIKIITILALTSFFFASCVTPKKRQIKTQNKLSGQLKNLDLILIKTFSLSETHASGDGSEIIYSSALRFLKFQSKDRLLALKHKTPINCHGSGACEDKHLLLSIDIMANDTTELWSISTIDDIGIPHVINNSNGLHFLANEKEIGLVDVWIIPAATPQKVFVQRTNRDKTSVIDLDWSSQKVLRGIYDNTSPNISLRLTDFAEGKNIGEMLIYEGNGIRSFYFEEGGRNIVSPYFDGLEKCWIDFFHSSMDHKKVTSLSIPCSGDPIFSMRPFFGKPNKLMTLYDKGGLGRVYLINTETGKLLRTFHQFFNSIESTELETEIYADGFNKLIIGWTPWICEPMFCPTETFKIKDLKTEKTLLSRKIPASNFAYEPKHRLLAAYFPEEEVIRVYKIVPKRGRKKE